MLQRVDANVEVTTTVLVVDDEPEMREVLRAALEHAGFHVLEADGGEAALALLRTSPHEVDVVITDGVMPGMGGRELLWRLSEQWPDLPVIFSSGILPEERALADLDVRPAAYVGKPFDPRAMVVVVRGVLEE